MLLVCVLAIPSKSKAQISLDSYYNIDWQFNIPLGNSFSNGASGWGMNFEPPQHRSGVEHDRRRYKPCIHIAIR